MGKIEIRVESLAEKSIEKVPIWLPIEPFDERPSSEDLSEGHHFKQAVAKGTSNGKPQYNQKIGGNKIEVVGPKRNKQRNRQYTRSNIQRYKRRHKRISKIRNRNKRDAQKPRDETQRDEITREKTGLLFTMSGCSPRVRILQSRLYLALSLLLTPIRKSVAFLHISKCLLCISACLNCSRKDDPIE